MIRYFLEFLYEFHSYEFLSTTDFHHRPLYYFSIEQGEEGQDRWSGSIRIDNPLRDE